MPLMADALPDTAPLVRDLLMQVREQREAADAAELRVLELALEFAHASPALPGQERWEPEAAPSWLEDRSDLLDPEVREWIGIPAVRWDAPAAFAAANDMSTTAGKALLRDVLVLAHRAPSFWSAVCAGRVPAWRARRVAQALLGQPADVCRYVDTALAERLAQGAAIGPVVLDRLVDEAMLRLHAEQRELEQLEALDARYVTIDPATINHTGIGQLDARADWADLGALDDILSEIAHALAQLPDHEHDSLDVRRSVALGVLADPARALALLEGDADARPTRSRDLTALLHLSEANLLGLDPVATDADQRTRLDQVIRAWAGRPDVRLVIKPIRVQGPEILCDEGVEHDQRARSTHDPTRTDREGVELRDRTCVHPHCTRPARLCDLDHITAFDEGGVTCPHCNLAPLCRHHHRLKTLAGWRYFMLAPGCYVWTDPHGLRYLRTPDGTTSVA
jgi:hypothetical protein